MGLGSTDKQTNVDTTGCCLVGIVKLQYIALVNWKSLQGGTLDWRSALCNVCLQRLYSGQGLIEKRSNIFIF